MIFSNKNKFKKALTLSAGIFLVINSFFLIPSAKAADTSCSTSKYGNYSSTRCSNGLSASTSTYGNYSSTRYSDGTSCSTSKYGSYSSTSCSDGLRSSTSSYGNYSSSSISGGKKTCPYGRTFC